MNVGSLSIYIYIWVNPVKIVKFKCICAVRDSEDKVISDEAASVAGLLRVRGPVFVGQLHSDTVANLWRNRLTALPTTDRSLLYTCVGNIRYHHNYRYFVCFLILLNI